MLYAQKIDLIKKIMLNLISTIYNTCIFEEIQNWAKVRSYHLSKNWSQDHKSLQYQIFFPEPLFHINFRRSEEISAKLNDSVKSYNKNTNKREEGVNSLPPPPHPFFVFSFRNILHLLLLLSIIWLSAKFEVIRYLLDTRPWYIQSLQSKYLLSTRTSLLDKRSSWCHSR